MGAKYYNTKYPKELKEKAIVMLTTMSFKEVSRELNIPENTLRDWKKNEERINPEFHKLRDEKKKEFVDSAWRIIERSTEVLERRIERAIEREDEIDYIFQEVSKLNFADLPTEQRKEFRKRISALKIEDISKLAVVLGTVYDKQALINHEATSNVVNVETYLKQVEGDSEF